eukprot:695573-Prorocentrum_minimum.AAC.1
MAVPGGGASARGRRSTRWRPAGAAGGRRRPIPHPCAPLAACGGPCPFAGRKAPPAGPPPPRPGPPTPHPTRLASQKRGTDRGVGWSAGHKAGSL